jgi:dimethylglycine catabolism B
MIDAAGVILLGAMAGLAVQGVRLHRRWRTGREAAVDWWRGLRRVPHAYLHAVHDVVARDPYAARMHMFAAGGLVAALVLSVLRHVFGLGGRVAALAIVASLGVAAVGVAMVAARRWPRRLARLSGGAFDRLPLALAAALLFLLLAALLALPDPDWAPPVQAGGRVVMIVLGIASLGLLVHWSVDGPMRHAVAGVVHLATLARAARIAGARASDLAPLDLADETLPPRLGVAAIADMPWPRLAQFDACVQCGRCQEACPAHAAGQPLDPRAFVQALVRQTTHAPSAPIVGGAVRPETLWSCTTCRACVHECPMLIEHVDAIVDLRRHETLERGAVPPKAAVALTELVQTDTVCGQPLAARLDWAADLGLSVMADVGAAEVLLWVGEAGFDRRNQRSLRALVTLLRRAAVDVAVLGAEEADCGDLARRLGDEVTFQALARRNVATLGRYRFASIVTMDPHALHVLRNEYPAFGGQYRVQHHTAFLDDLFAAGRLAPSVVRSRIVMTYHDPCYLARYNGEVEAPRRLLARLGMEVAEMARAGLRARCCGWGGGAAFADVPATRRIPDLRMDHARETGASVVAVACPNCANMLEGVTGPRPEVADIAELVLAALDAEAVPA